MRRYLRGLTSFFAITRAFNGHRGPLPRLEQSTRQHHFCPLPPHTEAVQKALHKPKTSIFRAGRGWNGQRRATLSAGAAAMPRPLSASRPLPSRSLARGARPLPCCHVQSRRQRRARRTRAHPALSRPSPPFPLPANGRGALPRLLPLRAPPLAACRRGAGLGAVPRGAAGSCLRQGGGGGGSGLLPPPLRAACLPAMASRRSSRGTGGTPSPGPRRGERGWGRRSGAHGGSSVTHTPRVGALGRAEHPRVGVGALPGSLCGHTGLRAKDASPREAAGQQSPGDAAWRRRSGGACSSNTGRARWGWLALLVKWSEKVTNTSS